MHALYPEATVLGADTTVVVDGDILAKAGGRRGRRAHAAAPFRPDHDVFHRDLGGFAWRKRHAVEATQVTFSRIPAEELAIYIASGDPDG